MFSLPQLLKADRTANDPGIFQRHKEAFITLFAIINLLWVVLFYLNAYVFIPRFMYRRKTAYYLSALLLYIGFMLLVDWAFFRLFIPDGRFTLYNFFVFNIYEAGPLNEEF